jgi:hypothetical protein
VGRRDCLDGAENLALAGIRSPDHPARSESLYRLSYPGSEIDITVNILCICWSRQYSVHSARYIHQDRTSGRLPLMPEGLFTSWSFTFIVLPFVASL